MPRIKRTNGGGGKFQMGAPPGKKARATNTPSVSSGSSSSKRSTHTASSKMRLLAKRSKGPSNKVSRKMQEFDNDDNSGDSEGEDMGGGKRGSSSDEDSDDEDVTAGDVEEDREMEKSREYTGSTMSLSETAFIEKEKECHQLTTRVQGLSRTIMELRHVVGMRKNGGGAGKNKTRRRKETQTLTDKLNCGHVSSYWKKVVWPHVKILGKKWHVWSEKEASVSVTTMRLITVPSLMTPIEYWDESMCGFINDKVCALSSGLKEDIKKQHNGMYMN